MLKLFSYVNIYLNLKAPEKKNHLKMPSAKSSAAYFCLHYLVYVSMGANSVDPDQSVLQSEEQSDLGTHCLSKKYKNISTDDSCCDWRFAAAKVPRKPNQS